MLRCGVVVVLLTYLFSSVSADCEISSVVTERSPFLLSANKRNIVYPEHGKQNVNIKTGQNLHFGCSNGEVMSRVRLGSIAQATCVSGNNFRINGAIHSWRNIECSEHPVAIGRYTGRSCKGGMEGEIGFRFGNDTFISQIVVCFDPQNQDTLYTQYEIISAIHSGFTGTPRPLFEQDPEFYNVGSSTVNNLYVRANQRRTVNRLLGLAVANEKYIQAGQKYFLARGHLAARSDFFYPAQMNATFKYINAAPQWQTFNGQNWERVEMSTRNYANLHNVTLKVWTGTYGVTTLPHEVTTKDTELYLYVQNERKGIRVPALYWKIVLNPGTKRGVVLLGLNNPYEMNVQKYIICPDVSSSLNWLSWIKSDITRGYSYACSVPEFRKAVSYAPEVQASGLLL